MATTKQNQPGTVKITLFKGKGYEAPVPVWLNGVRYSVPRGIEVEVPVGVAEIIEHSKQEKDIEQAYIRQEN